MKIRQKIPLLLILGLLISGCNEITAKDMETRSDGKVYLKSDRRTPYTGPYVAYFPTKKIRNEDGEEEDEPQRIYKTGTYINGTKEGTWTTYKWNGEKREDKYLGGRLNGATTWFHTGDRKARVQEFVDGREDGGGSYYDGEGNVTKNDFWDDGIAIAYPNPEKRAALEERRKNTKAAIKEGGGG
ncbi:MAG: hypothetical protein HQL53_00595 [Magnetococcales bacterium]|nr:hypothetical protein [Magnetococcales bacterium]